MKNYEYRFDSNPNYNNESDYHKYSLELNLTGI